MGAHIDRLHLLNFGLLYAAGTVKSKLNVLLENYALLELDWIYLKPFEMVLADLLSFSTILLPALD